jgi:hypothetical protein
MAPAASKFIQEVMMEGTPKVDLHADTKGLPSKKSQGLRSIKDFRRELFPGRLLWIRSNGYGTTQGSFKEGMDVRWGTFWPPYKKEIPWWHPCKFPNPADVDPAELIDVCVTFTTQMKTGFSNSLTLCYPTMYCSREVDVWEKKVNFTGEKIMTISHSVPLESIHWRTSEMGYSWKVPNEWTEWKMKLGSQRNSGGRQVRGGCFH